MPMSDLSFHCLAAFLTATCAMDTSAIHIALRVETTAGWDLLLSMLMKALPDIEALGDVTCESDSGSFGEREGRASEPARAPLQSGSSSEVDRREPETGDREDLDGVWLFSARLPPRPLMLSAQASARNTALAAWGSKSCRVSSLWWGSVRSQRKSFLELQPPYPMRLHCSTNFSAVTP